MSIRCLLAALILAVSASISGIARAEGPVEHGVGDIAPAPYEFTEFLKKCGNPCTIAHSDGGMDDDFKAALAYIEEHGVRVQIKGVCASNCAWLAAQVPSKVCLGPDAEMYFHQSRMFFWGPDRRVYAVKAYSQGDPAAEPKLPPQVLAWVKSHGGFPWDGWTKMPFSNAREFWATC